MSGRDQARGRALDRRGAGGIGDDGAGDDEHGTFTVRLGSAVGLANNSTVNVFDEREVRVPLIVVELVRLTAAAGTRYFCNPSRPVPESRASLTVTPPLGSLPPSR